MHDGRLSVRSLPVRKSVIVMVSCRRTRPSIGSPGRSFFRPMEGIRMRRTETLKSAPACGAAARSAAGAVGALIASLVSAAAATAQPASPPGMPPLSRSTADIHYRAAITISDGAYQPAQSHSALVSRGTVGDTSATAIAIDAEADGVNGVYVHGDRGVYTVANSTIMLSGKGRSDFDGIAAGALVSQGATLVLKNDRITTNGVVSTATTATENGTLKVYRSTLIANGGPLPSGYVPRIGPGMMEPPSPLRLSGDARTTLTMGQAKSYFYDSTIIARGWGALSTDAAHGAYLEADNCDIRTINSGYGTYADNGATVAINRSRMHVATYGGVIAGTGVVRLRGDTIASDGNGVMIHDVMGQTSDVARLEIQGGRIASENAALYIKSANADITVDHAGLTAKNGDLILAVVNDDPNATKVNGAKVAGVNIVLRNDTLSGNILDLDPAHPMAVHFAGTKLAGVIKGAALWLDKTSKWTATGDSQVTLMGSVAIGQIDAPPDVTIDAAVPEGSGLAGTISLAGGGRLVVHAK